MQKKFIKLLKLILSLPRNAKILVALINDAALCVISLWIAFYLRIDQFVSLRENILLIALISIFLALSIFWFSGLYRTVFRYTGRSSLASISVAVSIYGLSYMAIITIYGINGIPRSIGILQPLILFFAICITRLGALPLLGIVDENNKILNLYPKVLIYGAGSAGRQLASALEIAGEMKVLGFIDDDKLLHDQVLQGKKIYSTKNLNKIINLKKITHVLLAMPSINRNKRLEIIKKISIYNVVVKTLPTVSDLIEERVTTSDIRELDVEDILGRDQVLPNTQLLTKNISSKIVMVTGAGGSIGSELCRQIIKLNPVKLILIEISEYGLYQIQSELEDLNNKFNLDKKIEIIPLLASVQDRSRLEKIFKIYKPNTVYHAAAYKHVPLVEENICAGLKNNVIGTLAIAETAIKESVSDFVLISSDKAVRPTNVMGASKRLAELCLQALFHSSKNSITKLCMVRFGNVLNSSGSVIPLFKKQIKNGGPVTLTHPDVSRYFMTIPEAVQLVIQAGAMAKGSDVFVLDMGKPVKINDLIKKIISLSGLTVKDDQNPDGDISIKVIGLRPAEKLYEELLLGDNPQPTEHAKIQKAQDTYIPWNKLRLDLENLETLINYNNISEILFLLKKLVNGYSWDGQIVDKVFQQQEAKYNYSKNNNYEIEDSKVIKIKK